MLFPPARCAVVLVVFVALTQTGALAAEVPLDQPAYRAAPRNQSSATVASNGEHSFVLWNDERTDAPQKHAARIAPDGTALDPNGIRIRSASRTPGHVVWAADVWCVVSEGEWDEERGGQRGPELTRVDRHGKVLDPAPRILPIRPRTGITVATDGRLVAVGYDGERGEKRALIVDAEGAAIADFALSSAGAALAEGPPAIGSNGSAFAALWVSGAGETPGSHSVAGVRFDRNGALGAPRPVFGSFSGITPAMASDGRDFVVIQQHNVYRMTADLAVEFLFGAPRELAHSVVWTGSAYAIVLGTGGDARDVKIVTLDRDGRRIGERTTRLQGRAGEISGRAAAANGDALLLVWHDRTEEPLATIEKFTDTYAAAVSLPELEPGPRVLLSVSATEQFRPATASSATHHVTVWHDGAGLHARRHGRTGRADGRPVRLSAGAGSAAVVFDGSDFLVASAEGREIVVRRLPGTGGLRVAGESRIAAGSFPRHVALATGGGAILAAWFDNHEYNFHGGTVHAARIGAGGSFLDGQPLVLARSDLARTVQSIAVSANDSGEFLVVWGGTNRFCYCSPPMLATSDVLRAARVSGSSGAVLDASPIRVVDAVSPYDGEGWPHDSAFDPEHSLYADHPSAAWNGSEWLVVWNRGFRVAAGGEAWIDREEVRGRRIARNGTLLDGTARDPGILIAQDAFAPAVVWTGSGYRLAWYAGLPNHRDRTFSDHPLLRIRTASFDRPGGPLTELRTIGEAKWADPVSFSVWNGRVSSAHARIADEPQYGGISRAFLDLPATGLRRRAIRN